MNYRNIKVKNLRAKLEAIEEIFDGNVDWNRLDNLEREAILSLFNLTCNSLDSEHQDHIRVGDVTMRYWVALKTLMTNSQWWYIVSRNRYILPSEIRVTIDKMLGDFRTSMEYWADSDLHKLGFCPFIVNRRYLNDFDTQDWKEGTLFNRWLDRYLKKLEKKLIEAVKSGIWDGTLENFGFKGEQHPLQSDRVIGMFEFDRPL